MCLFHKAWSIVILWIDFTILNLQKGNILSKFVLNFQLHNAMDNTLILSPDGKVLVGVNDKRIKSVVVPDGVIEIGNHAFINSPKVRLLN